MMALATFNLNTPNIPDEADILTQVRQIRSYITNLNNQLRYNLSNIDEDNLTGGELPENAISRGFRQKVHDLQGNMSVFEQTATRILARVENAEGDISSLEQTATSFGTRITNAEGDISTLEQTATSFGTRITNAEGDISTLEQTAQGLQTEVTNAKGDISGLQQTATGLQTQVNNLGNRNRTYLPSTVPSVSERVEGDLLIDTANGNILKRWNGSAWVPVQDGAISIAQQQADKIQWLVASGTSAANMTLTSQLYSLMAANINLSANNSIKLAVSGGTNLWTNTDFENGFSEWFGNKGTETFVNAAAEFGAPYVYKGKNLGMYIPANGAGMGFDRPFSGLVVGEYYTISFHPRFTRAMLLSVDGATPASMTVGLNYNWAKVSFTFVAGQASGNIKITAAGSAVEAINCFDNVKLEKGTMATDWSPAPSDPASGVKTSHIDIATDHIDISSGGNLSITSPNTLKITSGTTNATALAVRNDTDYFISAG
ncbi:MAG: hypothetical protein GX611_06880, partial [Clostridiales bacterium]|nr:hypothetical protein [Clostridiales bacterium]